MNQDQIFGLLRTLCTAAGTILGWSATQTTQLTSAILGLASFVFFAISLYGTIKSNTVKSKTASVASTLPPGGQIATTPEIANAIPDSRVVPVTTLPQAKP